MPQTGSGTTVTFGTSNFSANIISLDWGGVERDDIETTHLGTTTAKTFIPEDLYDPGDLTLTIQYDASSASPPFAGAAETVTVAYSDGTSIAGTGYINSFTPGNAEVGELSEAEISIKFSGALTITAGSS